MKVHNKMHIKYVYKKISKRSTNHSLDTQKEN